MEKLAYTYKSDIMWCDAGASNGTDKFAAKWFNWARSNGRQVTINDRCGSPWAADFDTPEYATFSMPQERKWESNQGMDPFSYGFNRATKAEEYMNATTLVHNLVDITSKNGNLLLNIGPKHDGTIHPSMMGNLRQAGTWIKTHGEALFNTTYWFMASEENNLRFTQTNDAFYIINLGTPTVGRLQITSPVPALPGDKVYAVTMKGERKVRWGVQNGRLWIDVTRDIVDADRFAWVFKVEYGHGN
jgi:alpha-L-fucosidase